MSHPPCLRLCCQMLCNPWMIQELPQLQPAHTPQMEFVLWRTKAHMPTWSLLLWKFNSKPHHSCHIQLLAPPELYQLDFKKTARLNLWRLIMLSLIFPKWQDWAKPSCIRYTMQLLTRLSMKKGEKKRQKRSLCPNRDAVEEVVERKRLGH